jgi:3-oxoacyl-ACP reductase-like protein
VSITSQAILENHNGGGWLLEHTPPQIGNERPTMKNGKLNGKVAVVTGASKGIGASIAKHLAAEGAAVIVNYASSKTDADNVVAEHYQQGRKGRGGPSECGKEGGG